MTRRSTRRLGLATVFAILLLPVSAQAQFVQQGPKLVGPGATGTSPQQGRSVAVSADGNTAVVGGPTDNPFVGASWVFTRSGAVWTPQGSKLVGSGAAGAPVQQQGFSIALSADGNTFIAGGVGDGNNIGAAWIFTRSGGAWSQQGDKLVGGDREGNSRQGYSVAISADGNTAIVGGSNDNLGAGAAWVWTRSGGVWSQQGDKLVGSEGATNANQGTSVALSGDGNTAIVGGPQDNGIGAAWVWIRTGAVWTQQGDKLVGTGFAGFGAFQGSSVALSFDGNTAMVGGSSDNGSAGATWVFTRSGSVWTPQGSKLVGTGGMGASAQGHAVSLSSDGNKAIIGGNNDNFGAGAVWIWTRSGSVWSQQGSKLVGTGAAGPQVEQGGSVSLSGDGLTAVVGGRRDNSDAGATWVFAAPAVPGSPTFTDSPLVAGVTPIKIIHMTELRTRIDALRALHPPLAAYPYAEAITSATPVKAQHILELRQALLEVYEQIPQTPPTYTTTPAPGGTVVVADIQSLRAAVIAIE